MGLLAYAITIPLKEFVRAREDNPDVPRTANEICATQAVYECQQWGIRGLNTSHYHLFFDQNEPFRGHIMDRLNSKRTMHNIPNMRSITECCQADMRYVPALQLADLVGWCASHNKNRVPENWHRKMLGVIFQVTPSYSELVNPVPLAVKFAKEGKFPKRKLHP
jgi:hypothetical protein